MSIIGDIAGAVLPAAGTVLGTTFGGPVGGAIGGALGSAVGGALTGGDEAGAGPAATQSAAVQAGAAREAQGLLDPFAALGSQGLNQAGFLTDPQAQFDFLQSNPLFQQSLENANIQTQNLAAARGRLSAGDTLEQLSSNVLLSASPLIQQQRQAIQDQINLGERTAASQGNLITGAGAATAAGIVGEQRAQADEAQNRIDRAAQLAAQISGQITPDSINTLTNSFSGLFSPPQQFDQNQFAAPRI